MNDSLMCYDGIENLFSRDSLKEFNFSLDGIVYYRNFNNLV